MDTYKHINIYLVLRIKAIRLDDSETVSSTVYIRTCTCMHYLSFCITFFI